MLSDFFTGVTVLLALFMGGSDQNFGAFGDPFLSVQLATSPSNGLCLTTDGTNNAWTTCATGSGGSGGTWSTTTSQVSGRLVNYSNNTTDIVAIGANSTTTAEFWFDPNNLRSFLTFASSTGITATNFWGNLTGDVTGNAATASALAGNGGNCTAGNAPAGVDALGEVEDCFNVWTEAENTSAAYISLGSLSATAPIRYVSGVFSWLGLATTTQPTSSQLLVSNGGTGVYGVSTSTLSASSPLTGSFTQVGSGGALGIQNAAADGSTKGAASFTAADFDATTGNISIDYTNGQASSGSLKGFLTSADWTTFNNKAPTANPTFTGLATFANASSTLFSTSYASSTRFHGAGLQTCGTNTWLSWAAGIFTCASLSTTGDWTGTIDGNNFTGGAVASGDLLYGSGAGTIAELSMGASSTVLTTNGTTPAWQNIATYIIETIRTASIALTGAWDFGGASSIEIVNGSAPTVDATGEIAWDTTSGQQIIYDGAATRVLSNGYQYSTFTYSTSTAWVGTTTIPLGPAGIAETWSQTQCFTDAGTLNIRFGDGTNYMTMFSASTTVGVMSLSSNNTFTLSEKRYVDIGTPASSPTKVSCTVRRAITAD